MALTKGQKKEVITEVAQLLGSSKMTVIANYKGTTVKDMQHFRRQARVKGTVIKIAKNRLVKLAISQIPSLKDIDMSALEGMLLYAFNSQDEVAPAQVIDAFNKKNQTLEFIGAISAEGKFLSSGEVRALATLPNKPLLIAEVLAVLISPLNDTINGLSGNLHSILDGVAAKVTN